MKIKFLLTVLLFSTPLIGQTGFRPGYIIKSDRDTLFGEINYQNEEQMCKICSFRMKDNTNAVNYSASEISGYRFIDGKYFVSKNVDNKTVFLEFLIKGKVNIYYSTDFKVDHYYIEKDSIGLIEMPYKEEYKIKGNNEVLVKSKKHIGLLTYYMQDAPNLQSEIQSIKTPDRKNLIALAKDYHKKVCNDYECIVFEDKPVLIKVNLEIFTGVTNFPEFGNAGNPIYFTSGILAHIWIPSFNENCFLRTGLKRTFIKLPSDISINTSASGFRIPLQIEYIFPAKLVQPKLAIGCTLYPSPFGTFNFPVTSMMIGTDIKFSKRYFLSVNYDLDFTSNYFIINGIGSNALIIGLNVTL